MARRVTMANMVRRTKDFRKNELRQNSTIGDPLKVASVTLHIPNAPAHGLRIAVIPDTQVFFPRPNTSESCPIDHLAAYGKYIADKQPDVIVGIGDWWDLPSLSLYDKPGSLEMEGKRYKKDVAAGCDAMEAFLNPIAKAAGYKPTMVFTLGNHEDRIDRAIRADPTKLLGVISLNDLKLQSYGWKVYPFLQPVTIAGVVFCHFMPSGVMGRPITTARALLAQGHVSTFVGHQQGRQIAYAKRADGKDITAIISGSFYQHDESYLNPYTNLHWRGAYFLNEVKDGAYDEMALSVGYLKRRYGS